MTRKRFIDPGFWSDTATGKLSPAERLFFIGCFSNADDEGRLVGNPAYLRSVIFPYDDFTLEEIQQMRDQVARVCRNFLVYQIDGEEYIAFAKWGQYQSPRYARPSRLPAPPGQTAAASDRPIAGNAKDKPAGAAATGPEEEDETSTQGCAEKAASLTQDCAEKDASLQLRDGDGDGVVDGDGVGDGDGDGVGDGCREVETGPLAGSTAPRAEPATTDATAATAITGLFEAELGRPLSPLETAEVSRMAEASGEGLVAEALRRAVSRGNVRLDYVAGILASWNQKGLATPEEVRLHEAAAARASPGSRGRDKPDKYADVYVT